MYWLLLFLIPLLSISMTLGGCVCCGCLRCEDAPTTYQATLSGISNKSGSSGCNSTPGCDDLNATYSLNLQGFEAALHTDLLTASEDDFGCTWNYQITPINCSTDDCDDCDCDYTFADHGGSFPDLSSCEAGCEFNPVSSEGGEPGTYLTGRNSNCDDCALDHDCTVECGDASEPGACSCVSDGMGGYECQCAADCNCETDCSDAGAQGEIFVNLYRAQTTLDTVLFVQVTLPGSTMYRGEEVFTGEESIACIDTFTITLTKYEDGVPYCDDPASIEIEFS